MKHLPHIALMAIGLALVATKAHARNQPEGHVNDPDVNPPIEASHYLQPQKLSFDEIMLGRRQPRFAQAGQPQAWKPELNHNDKSWNLNQPPAEQRSDPTPFVPSAIATTETGIALLAIGAVGWLILGVLAWAVGRGNEATISNQ